MASHEATPSSSPAQDPSAAPDMYLGRYVTLDPAYNEETGKLYVLGTDTAGDVHTLSASRVMKDYGYEGDERGPRVTADTNAVPDVMSSVPHAEPRVSSRVPRGGHPRVARETTTVHGPAPEDRIPVSVPSVSQPIPSRRGNRRVLRDVTTIDSGAANQTSGSTPKNGPEMYRGMYSKVELKANGRGGARVAGYNDKKSKWEPLDPDEILEDYGHPGGTQGPRPGRAERPLSVPEHVWNQLTDAQKFSEANESQKILPPKHVGRNLWSYMDDAAKWHQVSTALAIEEDPHYSDSERAERLTELAAEAEQWDVPDGMSPAEWLQMEPIFRRRTIGLRTGKTAQPAPPKEKRTDQRPTNLNRKWQHPSSIKGIGQAVLDKLAESRSPQPPENGDASVATPTARHTGRHRTPRDRTRYVKSGLKFTKNNLLQPGMALDRKAGSLALRGTKFVAEAVKTDVKTTRLMVQAGTDSISQAIDTYRARRSTAQLGEPSSETTGSRLTRIELRRRAAAKLAGVTVLKDRMKQAAKSTNDWLNEK